MANKESSAKKKRTRIAQTDVPNFSLDEAIRVPRAIVDNYAGQPATPLQVAKAMDMSPTSGTFRNLCGASIAYGLTEGGYNASEIAVKDIAKRILRPLEDGQDLAARREAILLPRVIGEFLRKYDNSPLPKENIAQNVLETMGVPADRTQGVLAIILDAAKSVGFITSIKNKDYVDLSSPHGAAIPPDTLADTDHSDGDEPAGSDDTGDEGIDLTPKFNAPPMANSSADPKDAQRARRVFITHGKNKAFVEPIKKLLGFGEMTPVVSVDKQSVSKPVPDKVMDDMRSCGAAIIHVESEKEVFDKDANEHVMINPNVLIEIGAAMALYGRRYILLVRQGVNLPSNLQGLYEVRYNGDTLDGDATIRLLEAINEIKNNPLPSANAAKP